MGMFLLDHLFGATVEKRPKGTDMQVEMEELAKKLKMDNNQNAYVIPGGGSNAIGALGYAQAAFELVNQANRLGLKIDSIVHATGSAGTQAGLVTGIKAMNAKIPVLGIGVNVPYQAQQDKVLQCTLKTAQHLQLEQKITTDDIVINCDYIGQGYGFPAPSTIEAIEVLAVVY